MNSASPDADLGAERLEVGAVVAALGAGEAVGRRNFDAFVRWAKLERDWLTPEEVEHLGRATILARKYNRSLTQAFKAARRAPKEATAPHSGPDEEQPTPAEPPPEPETGRERARLGEMAHELRALRAESEASRRDQGAVLARLRTEDAYYGAWEARLRRAEEEVAALWALVDELVKLSGATAPRLEKLERRVGYDLRRPRDAPRPDGEGRRDRDGPPKKEKEQAPATPPVEGRGGPERVDTEGGRPLG